MTARRVITSPLGPIVLEADLAGRLTAVHIAGARPGADLTLDTDRAAPPGLDDAATQIAEYFGGARRHFDLDLSFRGTAFQRRVWSALWEIPFGATLSYGELADLIGRTGAARAVGHANGRNPIPLVVPCHRVIGSTGGLTGYGGGLEAKRFLLDFESECLRDQKSAAQSSGCAPSSSVSRTAMAVPHTPTTVPARARASSAVTAAALGPSSTPVMTTATTKAARMAPV